MADAKSEKGTWLNYIIQLLATVLWFHFIRETACSRRLTRLFLFKTLWTSNNLFVNLEVPDCGTMKIEF